MHLKTHIKPLGWIVAILLILPVLNSCNHNRLSLQRPVPQDFNSFAHPVDFDLKKIMARDTLIAIIDNSSTGCFIYKGQPMGYEYELLHLLASELRVNLKIMVISGIEKAFQKLNSGEADLIAHNLTITKDRLKKAAFTRSLHTSRQVLVQRKPENWRQMKRHEIEARLIRNPLELIGKEVHVRKNSSYDSRLQNLSNEIGGDIIIVEGFVGVETEALIKKVADGTIEYTVADDYIARVNQTYYPQIDIKTAISLQQQIGWATRKNAPELLQAINQWLGKMKKKTLYYALYNKYFKNPKISLKILESDYTSFNGDKLSPYDSLLKISAKKLAWDWRLLASQVFQESRFNPKVQSWAGATGLMQLLPETATLFGARDMYDPYENIRAGTKYLLWLDDLWKERVSDPEERIKFVLASYNVGQGHVLDACRLATKHGKDARQWENVAHYILLKSKPKYYNDPVVSSGYCRGEEPVNYVKEIIHRFGQYKAIMHAGDDGQKVPS